MQQEQIKSLLVNIFTGAVIVGVLIASYFVFLKPEVVSDNSIASVAVIAEETTSIGVEIDATKKDLRDLSRAVASSSAIFKLPAFMNLKDFTVAIPEEPLGRVNPFLPTEWKLKMKAMEETTNKKSMTSASKASVPVVSAAQLQASVALINTYIAGI